MTLKKIHVPYIKLKHSGGVSWFYNCKPKIFRVAYNGCTALYVLSSYVLNINLHQCMTDECLEVMYLHICNVLVHAPKLRKLPVIETDYTEPTDTKLFS